MPFASNLKLLSWQYGVPTGQLEVWFAGGCGIDGCSGTDLAVDHDHECCAKRQRPTCGRCTRGILCRRHNVALEVFLDSPAVLAYLKRTEAGRTTLIRMGLNLSERPVPLGRRPVTPDEAIAHERRRAARRRKTQRPRDRRSA
jgi:hypothetical protein